MPVAIGVILLVSWLLNLNFGQFISRLDRPPSSLKSLAVLQQQMCLLPFAVGSATAAWVTSRLIRGQGKDLWVTASRRDRDKVLLLHLWALAPLELAWALFWAASSWQFGQGKGAGFSSAAFLVGAFAIAAGCALGQMLGHIMPSWIATAGAAILGYLLPATYTAMSDDTWWQPLGPGLGSQFPDSQVAAWILSLVIWFTAATVLLLTLCIGWSSVPRRLPRRPVATLLGVCLLAIIMVGTTSGTSSVGSWL